MSDDRFLDRLREEAQTLRYEADDVTYVRLQSRIRGRIAAPSLTVSQLLGSWLRPVGVSLAALALAVALIAGFEQQQTRDAAAAIDSITASASVPSMNEELLGGD